MASHHATTLDRRRHETTRARSKVAAMLLGLAVAVVGFFALLMWADARDARDRGFPVGPRRRRRTITRPTTTPRCRSTASPAPCPRTRRRSPRRTRAYDAALPPLPRGDVVKVHMMLKDMTVEIAPGVKYNAWAFDGTAPRARRPRPRRARRSR